MVAPSGSGGNFDILFRFITEMVGEDAAKKVAGSMGEMDKQVKKSNEQLAHQTALLKNWKRELDDLKVKAQGIGKYGAGYDEISKKIALANAGIKYQKQVVDDAKAAHKALVAELRREDQAQKQIIANMHSQEQILNRRAAVAQRISSGLQGFGNTAVVAGTAIGGGIVAEATRYAQKMGDATEGTREFNAELAKLAKARGRIDDVLVAQVLPILQMATKVANITAGIVEKNPQLVGLALKGAALLVSIGTLAKIAASGIKMYADATFFAAQSLGLRAAEMQLAASENQLLAAGASSGKYGVKGGLIGPAQATGGGALAIAGQIVLAIGAAILAAIATKEIGNAIQRKAGVDESSWGDIGRTAKEITLLLSPLNLLSTGLNKLGLESDEVRAKIFNLQKWILGLGGAADETKDQGGSTSVAGSANEKDIVSAFSDMKDDLLKEEQDFESSRLKITQDATNSILKATASAASAISSINARAESQRGNIISDYLKASKEAEQNYNKERAQIIRDGGIEIMRLEEDKQEKLRQLEMDHQERLVDLIDQRDALGIYREQQKYERDRDQINRDTDREIAERRQDIGIRLKDLAEGYRAERAQRNADYIQKLQENEAQRAAAVKERQEALANELQQLQEERNIKLRELDAQHRIERQAIQEAFYAKIRDLDAFLLGEANLRKARYAQMLAQTDAFLAAYRNKTASGLSAGMTPSHDYTGYAYTRTYAMAQDGKRQFVLSGDATRAAERMLGGRLSQPAVMSALSGGGMQYIDNSHYAPGIGAREVRTIRQIARQEIKETFRK